MQSFSVTASYSKNKGCPLVGGKSGTTSYCLSQKHWPLSPRKHSRYSLQPPSVDSKIIHARDHGRITPPHSNKPVQFITISDAVIRCSIGQKSVRLAWCGSPRPINAWPLEQRSRCLLSYYYNPSSSNPNISKTMLPRSFPWHVVQSLFLL